MLPRAMAIRALGELSDDEWSATKKAKSMPATSVTPPPAARPMATRMSRDRRAPAGRFMLTTIRPQTRRVYEQTGGWRRVSLKKYNSSVVAPCRMGSQGDG